MYDILQLNDMLVPELIDIAEQLKIPNAKKLSKQDLVYKILDGQAIAGSKGAVANNDGRRKRIVKTNTSVVSEEAIVESTGEEKPAVHKAAMPNRKEDKHSGKKPRKKNDEKTETPVAAESVASNDKSSGVTANNDTESVEQGGSDNSEAQQKFTRNAGNSNSMLNLTA